MSEGSKYDSLLSAIFKNAQDIILVHEMNGQTAGRIVMANDYSMDVLGYPRKELLQKKFTDLLPKGYQPPPPHVDPLRSDAYIYECILKTRSGKNLHVEVRSSRFISEGRTLSLAVCRDINKWKRNQQELGASKDKYQRLVEQLSEEYIFYAHDADGMITYVSPSIKPVLGYTQEEALRNFKDFLTDHPINKESLKHSQETLRGNPQPGFVNELYHRDGSTRWFYNNEIPIFDENGKVIAVEGIARNITQSVLAEEELKKSEERFRLMVESLEGVFWMINIPGDRLDYISPQCRNILNINRSELSEDYYRILERVHPEDKKMVQRAMERMVQDGGFNIEFRIRYDEEIIRWLWARSHVVSENKKPKFVVGKIFDITQRKQQETEFASLAAILENTADHAVIKDLNLKVIASNKANTRAAGFHKMEDIIGKTDLEIFGDKPHVRQYMKDEKAAQKLKPGETITKEEIFEYPDGKKITTQVKKFPVFDQDGKVIATANISRDITELLKKDEAIRMREVKLKEAIASKNKFFNIIAHDLKNPFNTILGFTQLLIENYDEYDEKTLKRYLKMIFDASMLSLDLLDNLLNWARAQTGNIKCDPKTRDIGKIIDKSFKLLKPNADKKDIRLIKKIPGSLKAYVDENMITTVIRNLLSNAIKFTHPKGKVHIQAKMKKNRVIVSISDNGIGIKEEDIKKLFRIDEGFTRPGTNQEAGTGLGLILCKEFIERNRGSIEVESKADKGSTFTLILPSEKPE